MKLPPDTGYSVNSTTGMVHTRHPGEHAGMVRKARTTAAVDYYLDGKPGRVCRTCYPVKAKETPNAAPVPRVRRTDQAEPLPQMRLGPEQG